MSAGLTHDVHSPLESLEGAAGVELEETVPGANVGSIQMVEAEYVSR